MSLSKIEKILIGTSIIGILGTGGVHDYFLRQRQITPEVAKVYELKEDINKIQKQHFLKPLSLSAVERLHGVMEDYNTLSVQPDVKKLLDENQKYVDKGLNAIYIGSIFALLLGGVGISYTSRLIRDSSLKSSENRENSLPIDT